jgi:predicted RNase H-like nuclease (RuvC/YqgF family)
MENINFQPVFDYIDDKVDELKSELTEELASKKDIQGLQTSIDNLAKQTLDNSKKVTLLDFKANRLEGWVMQAAEKTEIPYNP